MIKINKKTTICELIQTHPDILDVMVTLGFEDITKPGMLQTAGRVMTLEKGSALKRIEWKTIEKAFNEKGYAIE